MLFSEVSDIDTVDSSDARDCVSSESAATLVSGDADLELGAPEARDRFIMVGSVLGRIAKLCVAGIASLMQSQ